MHRLKKEIERLLKSPHLQLAKKEERVRLRGQYLYQLRSYEKKGKELAESGITFEVLEAMAKDCEMEL